MSSKKYVPQTLPFSRYSIFLMGELVKMLKCMFVVVMTLELL